MKTSEVTAAIADIEEAYPGAVSVTEDGQGGAMVVVDDVRLGDPYVQESTWIGFHITHLHPSADVYPHHVRGDLSRQDGQGLGSATSSSSFDNRPSVQLSRRSNRRDAATDTPLIKMERVLAWVRAK